MDLDPPRLLKKSLQRLGNLNADMLQRGLSCYEQGAKLCSYGNREMLRAMELNAFLFNRFMEGGVIPALQSTFEINNDIADSFVQTVSGDKDLRSHLSEIGERVSSGIKYKQLVNTMGRELFGSARFDGEALLAENDLFTLSYLPPVDGSPARQAALFHVGGFLPFGDRIFRILPEANLYRPFVARGIPVYAMELRTDRLASSTLRACTLDRFIQIIDELSDRAFEHHRRRKMIIEGYCGLGMPMLAYLAARPREADAKFTVAMTMVAPIDGRKCKALDDMVTTIPRHFIVANQAISELMGYFSGQNIQVSLDIPLNSLFYKSNFGRFIAGWKNASWARVKSLKELDFNQRRELAGAYWISPGNCRRFPMPVDLANFASNLWLEGIDDDLQIPHVYEGRQLGLRTIAEQTGIRIVGFYGATDPVVPNETAHVLVRNLSDRYTHVVHPRAGHISYVLSPEVWAPGHKYALDPNPIDVICDLYQDKE